MRANPPPGAAGAPPPIVTPIYPTFSTSVIGLSKVKEDARKSLVNILDSVKGKKVLVLDPRLSGPLGQIAEMTLLKEHGVEKIYYITPGRFFTESKTIVYLVRPKVEYISHILDNIAQHAKENQSKDYYIFVVPRITKLISTLIYDKTGILHDQTSSPGPNNHQGGGGGILLETSRIQLGEYDITTIPFDDDILSMEYAMNSIDYCMEDNKSRDYYVSKCLIQLQIQFGMFPKVIGKGESSCRIVEMISKLKNEYQHQFPNTSPEIDQLIIFDRKSDMVTPLLTPLTYEGLIDELIGIQNGFVEVDPQMLATVSKKEAEQPNNNNKKSKIPLNANDRVFSSLRDLNFNSVGPLLNKKAKEIDEYYKQRNNNLNPSQLRDYMKKFSSYQQEHQSSNNHTAIALHIQKTVKDPSFPKRVEAEMSLISQGDSVDDYIEECINKQESLVKVLRLLCLSSLVNNGFKQKQFEFFKREVLQSYGFEHIQTLENLEKMGLFKKQEGKSSFPVLRKAFDLFTEDIDENNPDDFNYGYSGYAPLSVRLIQNFFRHGWEAKDDSMRMFTGPTAKIYQDLPQGSQQRGTNATRNNVTLVFFVGGVTFAEISALRWLSKHDGATYGDFVIGTTKLINGNSLMHSLMENLNTKNK